VQFGKLNISEIQRKDISVQIVTAKNMKLEANINNIDYSVYTFYGTWHGCIRRIGA